MKVLRLTLVLALVLIAVLFAFWIWLTFPLNRKTSVRLPWPTNAIWLNTGLTADEQVLWHHLPEGSEAVPLSVLESLISPRTGKPFLHSLADYGFLLESHDPLNLPVGWSVRTKPLGGKLVHYVGINCAGCHTGELQFQGKAVRVDGAPNLFALEDFFVDLRQAIDEVQTNRWKTLLFARSVIRHNHALQPDTKFMELSREALAYLESVDETTRKGPTPKAPQSPNADTNAPAAPPPEPGEDAPSTETTATGDAIRELFASLLREGSYLQRRLLALETLSTAIDCGVDLGPGRGDSFGIIRQLLWPFDHTQLDAPVSTPHLFNFGQFNWIHWDGNTRSVMQRNVAQAIALGADFDQGSYQSGALPLNLHRLELVGRQIKPPAWPESVFGPIDRAKAERGKPLFTRLCTECHTGEKIYPVEQVGTSPVRATNFALPLAGRPFPESLAGVAAFAEAALLQQHDISPDQAAKLEIPNPEWRATRGYIARSLAGIWATAPYLHNGSVPTLYDLLLPAAQRPAKFPVGHREFDPKKLGFVTEVPNPGFVLDTSIQGNRNHGHEFGTDLSDDAKWDLIEYIKTL